MHSRHFPEEPSRGFPEVIVVGIVVASVILLVVMNASVEFSHVNSSNGWAVQGGRKDFLKDFLTEALKVYCLRISLLGLLSGLSGQLSLESFLKDSLKEFP